MIGKKVTVTIDRKIGSVHPKYNDTIYPINYGYVKGIIGGDGDFQDAYVLGIHEPIAEFSGVVIAVIKRDDDVEEKWVVAKEGVTFKKDYIEKITFFQEKFYQSMIIM